MPDVSFTIANRPYTIRCAPGQEDQLQAAATRLAERVENLAARAGGTDDRRLLVIAALELIDALSDAENAPGTAAKETSAAKAEAEALRTWAGSIADRLDAAIASATTSPADDLAGDGKDA